MLRRWKSGGAPQPERFGATIEQEEARLIGLIAGGDLQAFDRLYRRYASRLTRFLERITHRSMLIGEIVNDTMLVVWRKANTYDLSSKVSTWIFAIAYRKALKAMKKFDEPFDCDFEQCSGDAMLEPENKMAQKNWQ